jgi:hypothetical protein
MKIKCIINRPVHIVGLLLEFNGGSRKLVVENHLWTTMPYYEPLSEYPRKLSSNTTDNTFQNILQTVGYSMVFE